jgi:hypothetical protein
MEAIIEIVEGNEMEEAALMSTVLEANRTIKFATAIRDEAMRLLATKFPQRPIEEDIAEIQEDLEIHFGLLKLYNSKPGRYLEDRHKVLQDIAALQVRLAEMGQ